MAAQADIIVIEGMSSGAVDPCCFGRRALAGAEGQRGWSVGGRKDLGHDSDAVLLAPGDHGADAVDEAHARGALGLFRHAVGGKVGNEPPQMFCQGHGWFLTDAGWGGGSYITHMA